MKIILLNGPPGCGKDEAAKCIERYIAENSKMQPQHIKFASPLKNAIHALYALDVKEDHFENCKEKPREEFFGRTPRELYIAISEQFTKPILQNDLFAKLFLRKCEEVKSRNLKELQKDTVIICSDMGFEIELKRVMDFYGNDHCLFIQIYRPEHDFKNDSRSYISGESYLKIHNDGTLQDFHIKIYRLLHNYLQAQYGSDY